MFVLLSCGVFYLGSFLQIDAQTAKVSGYKQLYGSCYVGYVKRLLHGFVKGRSPVVFKSRETASFPISFEMAGVSLTTLLHIVLSI